MSSSAIRESLQSPQIEIREGSVAIVSSVRERHLQGIDWTIRAGDFWVVGGLHGSGKSALLTIAAAVSPPESGSVYLFGEATASMHESALLKQRLRIGLVFEYGGRLFAGLNLAENVALPLRYHERGSAREIADRVSEVMDLMGLSEIASQYPALVSQDAKQRVGLARALMLQPEVLLLDNPLAGLDPRHRQWWRRIIRQFHQGHDFLGGRPLTIAVTAQDLSVWLAEGCRYAYVSDDQWHEVGDLNALKQSTDPVVLDLLSGHIED